uniref:Beta-microseminoprotein n=1 Tax=Neogobius melanostomus TaxID=47308 RepID=A0A8C6SAU5_9GOBI
MKYVTLALLLCAVASLSNGFCYFKHPTLDEDKTHCQDDVDATWHAVGSSWRNSKCLDCTCESCCLAYSIPRSFPPDCVSVFDQASCQYLVHKKNDPSTLCEIYGAVGK